MPIQSKELATIKKPGQVEYISKEEYQERVREIIKCKRDIKYFAENYFKIINLDKGLMTIKLYEKQKELLDFFVNERRCIVLASRQSSKTTTYTIYLLWLTMFHAEKKVMILANKLDTVIEICERIRLAYQYLPSFLKPGVLTWNKSEIGFSNLSVIKGFATSSDAARGFSCSCVFGDTIVTIKDTNGKVHDIRIDSITDEYDITDNLMVLTERGFVKFLGVKKSRTSYVYDIIFSDGSKLIATPEHRVKISDGSFVLAKDCHVGHVMSTGKKIVEVLGRNCDCDVYDLLNVDDGHEYLTNGVTSHNCVVMDEAAFVANNVASKVFESIYPVISSSKKSQFIMVSTPNGADPRNLYYEIWKKATAKSKEANADGWKPFRFDWFDIPSRTL
jgi:hypothetical protein